MFFLGNELMHITVEYGVLLLKAVVSSMAALKVSYLVYIYTVFFFFLLTNISFITFISFDVFLAFVFI
jgi:hypothetical protein